MNLEGKKVYVVEDKLDGMAIQICSTKEKAQEIIKSDEDSDMFVIREFTIDSDTHAPVVA